MAKVPAHSLGYRERNQRPVPSKGKQVSARFNSGVEKRDGGEVEQFHFIPSCVFLIPIFRDGSNDRIDSGFFRA